MLVLYRHRINLDIKVLDVRQKLLPVNYTKPGLVFGKQKSKSGLKATPSIT